MRYLIMSLLLAALPAQAQAMGQQACLQLIRDYWTEYEKTSVDPMHLFDKFAVECEATKKLDAMILKDEYINTVTARMTKKGILK